MRAWWILGVALVGCDATDAELRAADGDVELTEQDLVDDADPNLPLPPPLPVVMDLESTTWTAGEVATLTATGAIPGARVFFISGTGLGPTCPARLGGGCLDITGLTVLGSAWADVNGTAVLDHTVDAGLVSGTEVHVQAVVGAGAAYMSNVSTQVVDPTSSVVEDITLAIDGAKIYRHDPASGNDWDFDPFGIFNNPDPYFIVWVDNVYEYDSWTVNDTRFPYWGVRIDLTVPEGSILYIDVFEDDGYAWQGGDEYIGTLELSSDDLQGLVDQGMEIHVGTWALQELEVEVLSR